MAPEPMIRSLLAFHDLPYAAVCLTPERTHRPVTSSASAAEVREPMRCHTPATVRYGVLLDPLRKSLRSYDVTWSIGASGFLGYPDLSVGLA